MIKPTVGRVVLYRPGPHDDIIKNGTEPLAAIIATVWNDGMVNLAVFDGNGTCQPRTSIKLIQPNEPKPDGESFCHWMEYQIGQAAKYEALAAEKGK